MPALLGTNFDGNTLSLTLPYSGIWYITVDVDTGNLEPGTWDWIWMAEIDSIPGTILMPPSPSVDFGGGSPHPYWLGSLYDGPDDVIGDGLGSARPWCFEIN
jgi:hypothetical protein